MKCGTDMTAACGCNAPCMPKGQRCIAILRADPEALKGSNRKLADAFGVDEATIGKIRAQLSAEGAEYSAPDGVVFGPDGKSHPAKRGD